MTDFFSSPEFDQAVKRAAKALHDHRWPTSSWSNAPLRGQFRQDYLAQARAALLAVLQPEACPEFACHDGIRYVNNEPFGPCSACGGSGVSNLPPALFLAMSELLIIDNEGCLYQDVGGNRIKYVGESVQDIQAYRYVTLSTTTTED